MKFEEVLHNLSIAKAKANFNELLEYINENFDDNDPIVYYLRCGDVDIINDALEHRKVNGSDHDE